MRFRLIYKSPIPTNIVLWPFVFFTRRKIHVADTLHKHEFAHCRQVKRMGVFWFYLRYLYEMARWKHSERPLENEARDAEQHPLTDEERGWVAAGRVQL